MGKWVIVIIRWMFILITAPLWMPLSFLALLLFGSICHTKFYDHIITEQPLSRKYCGYCGVTLVDSNKPFHPYTGKHKWWCSIKRAKRNELIISSFKPNGV